MATPSNGLSRFAPWLDRFVLAATTFVLFMVALRFIADPVSAAAASGITLTEGVGVTNMRVGFGAFPLGIAITTLYCLISRQRHVMGLRFIATIMAVALVIRAVGAVVDDTWAKSLPLISAEGIMLILASVALLVESRSHRGIKRPALERVESLGN